MKEKNFKFRESFGTAINAMSDDQAGKLVKGLCKYIFNKENFETNNDSALKSAFALIKTMIDTEERDRENGKRGGKLSAEKRKKESIEMLIVTSICEKDCPMKNEAKENEGESVVKT